MNRRATWITLALLLAVWALAWWWRARREGRIAGPAIEKRMETPGVQRIVGGPAMRGAEPETARPDAAAGDGKAGRIEKIQRDYEELAAKLAAEFGAAGRDYPGGLNAYLRQLALLEREKRKDLAAILTPAELEDLEWHETRAGKEVQRWLGNSAATSEQQRAVFRLQRAFDEKYALEFDLTTPALLARETERQALQEKILAVLGPETFAAWAQSEGGNFAQFRNFAVQQGLVAEKALELWRVKNEFVRRNLANEALAGATDEQRAALRMALIEATRERIVAIAGPGAIERAEPDVFAWLEKRK